MFCLLLLRCYLDDRGVVSTGERDQNPMAKRSKEGEIRILLLLKGFPST